MDASWLQFVVALVVMYSVVAAAGYWGKRKKARNEAQRHNRQDT